MRSTCRGPAPPACRGRVGIDRDDPVVAHHRKADPSPRVVVVFPTPPLIDSTAMRKSPTNGLADLGEQIFLPALFAGFSRVDPPAACPVHRATPAGLAARCGCGARSPPRRAKAATRKPCGGKGYGGAARVAPAVASSRVAVAGAASTPAAVPANPVVAVAAAGVDRVANAVRAVAVAAPGRRAHPDRDAVQGPSRMNGSVAVLDFPARTARRSFATRSWCASATAAEPAAAMV